jgi:ABC-type amino acid transport substrate-binding protein
MMRKAILASMLLLFVAGFSCLQAAQNEQYQTVEALGKLNGVALSCRYFDQTRRIKRALIEGLPKQRDLGALFDDATSASFNAFLQSRDKCPGPAGFEADVGKAIDAMNQAFVTK